MNDAEQRITDAIAESRDELVELASALIRFDTTARDAGDPARDEAALQAHLAARLRAAGADVEVWEPRPDDVRGRQVPFELDFDGRPQLAGALRGHGRRPQPAAERPCRRRLRRAQGTLDGRPEHAGRARRQPLRARRLRHEGRRRGDGHGRRDALAARHPPRRRPAREHDHRRGVDGRRRHRLRRPRRARRRRHRARADRLRRLDRLPRLRLPDDHGRGAPGPRGAAAAALARRRRRQRDREGAGRARRDPRAARGVAHALGPAASLPLAARHRADRHARRRVVGHLPRLVRDHVRRAVPARASPTPTATARASCDEVRDAIGRACAADPWLAEHPPAFSWTADIPPMEIPPGDPIVQTMLAASADVGEPSRLGGLDSWYDGATYTLAAGTPSIAFGPRSIAGATRSTSTCPSTTSCAARRRSRSPPCASAGRHEHPHHPRRAARPGHAGPRPHLDAGGSPDGARAPPGRRSRAARAGPAAAADAHRREPVPARAADCRARPRRRSACRSRRIRGWPSSPPPCPRPGRSPRPTS